MHRLCNHEKHYLTLNNYLRDIYQSKVFRVMMDGHFDCPNRDGSIGTTGCTYCSLRRSGDFIQNPSSSLENQFHETKDLMEKKWDGLYIAYLQAGSNTYGSIESLKKIYHDIIKLDPKIKILSIATRCDCLDEEIINLLSEINQSIEVWLEIGLQTIHQKSQEFLDLGYNTQRFTEAMNLLNGTNIKVIVHIINGLPYETKEMMIETVQYLQDFSLFGIKIHMLHLLKGTVLETVYQKKPFTLLTMDEYVDIVVTQLRYIDENIVIHRLTGDGPSELLIEPKWTLKKFVTLNEIDKLMRKKNIYQGDLCQVLHK